MRALPLCLVLSSIFFSGCASAPPDAAQTAAHAKEKTAAKKPVPTVDLARPVPFPAPLRLPDTVTPRAYDIALAIDPASGRFSGTIGIDVDLAEATRLVRLHADLIAVKKAELVGRGAAVPLEVAKDGDNLALIAPIALAPGRARLELAWDGPLPESPLGVYRVQDGGRWYVYTQFEPLEARRAFPCFDEPRWKVPVSLSIDVPTGLRAVANNPELEPNGTPLAGAEAGWTRFRFATTPPLPTYLIAFAVGDFDLVEGQRVSGGRVPFRVVAPKGKGGLAGFVLDKTPRHLDWQEQWFGRPYPFAKLDLVAVPSFGSSGMENPGLITFRESLVLMDGDKAAIEDRIWCESVLAHELAHMWFGDLVTMAWWDDLWLNEAFAVWMSRKSLTAVSPELDVREQALRGKHGTMGGDARSHARAVRQPILTEGDVYNAFDGITYSKGAAVLEMIEAWIGADRFQAGVRSYLDQHAFGSATTADLVEHLQAESQGADVGGVMASFVDKPGVPFVRLDWRCEGDAVALEVSQTALKLLGDPRQSIDSLWKIPVCARLSDGKRTTEHCDVLDEAKETWTIRPGFCPTFAHPNIEEAGYFRWGTRLGPISTARGDKAAFAGLVSSLRTGLETGTAAFASLVDGVEPLVEPSVSPSELGDLLSALSSATYYDQEAAKNARFRKKAKVWLDRFPVDLGLGRTPRERRLMPALVRARAGLLADAKVLAEAKRVSERFLGALEGKGERPALEAVQVYLGIHVSGLGREASKAKVRQALWQRLREALPKTANPNERDAIIEALAAFDDPELVVKSYGLVVDGTLRAQDLRTLRGHTSGRKEIAHATWDWMVQNFDGLVARIGAKAAPGLPQFAGAFCSGEEAAQVEAFFASKAAVIPSGIERTLAQTLETIRACEVSRARYGAEARAWYQR